MKCRSSIDRDGRRADTPSPLDCVRACDPWLRRQIETVRPRAIIVAGAVACRHLLGTAIGEVHGTLIESPDRSTFYLPVYHPAAALRDPARMRDLAHAMKGIGLWLDAHPEIRRRARQYNLQKEVQPHR